MGRRGPQKTPTNILAKRGSKLVAKRIEHEPIPAEGIPECPDWVDDEGRAYWRGITETMNEMGVITKADQIIVGLIVDAMAQYVRAKEILKTEGHVCYSAKGSPYTHPEVVNRNKAADTIAKLLRNYGFTAADRASLGESLGIARKNRKGQDGISGMVRIG